MIMDIFGIEPCKKVGDLKSAIKDAILDGEIENNYDAAFDFMLKTAKTLGMKPVK
jgi:hypothetical protein